MLIKPVVIPESEGGGEVVVDWDKVLNKPFGDLKNLITELTIDGTSQYFENWNYAYPEDWYSIVIDDIEYNNFEKEFYTEIDRYGQEQNFELYGNWGIVASSYENNGLPYCIKLNTDTFALDIILQESVSHIVKIYESNTKPLEDKFIPNTIPRETDLRHIVSEIVASYVSNGGGAVIKSIQRGTVDNNATCNFGIAGQQSPMKNNYLQGCYDVTINEVDVSKSIVRVLTWYNESHPKIAWLENSTTLRIYMRGASGSSVSDPSSIEADAVLWEVIEFN